MRKLFISLLLIASLKGKSQTIDTSIHEYKAAMIVDYLHGNGCIPESVDTIRWVGYDSYVYNSKDSTCDVKYILRASDGRNVIRNTYKISAYQYNIWDGSDIGLISFIVNYLNFVFK
jgi:hypothetical protein